VFGEAAVPQCPSASDTTIVVDRAMFMVSSLSQRVHICGSQKGDDAPRASRVIVTLA
jgi:hypothetical protein